MNNKPKVFISYSHEDQHIATQIAKDLRANGIEAWIDKFEIIPGDSLISKIFEEGLANADVFLILLTPSSAQSNWVRQELDVALIKRIEGITRIITLRHDNVAIPDPLRSLRWIDWNGDYVEKLRELQMAIFQIREKPPIGQPPEFVRNQIASVAGLSKLATAVGSFLLLHSNEENGNEASFREKEIAELLELTPQETDDAIDELVSLGLVMTIDTFGTGPFSHDEVEATYALSLHFKDHSLNYDPEEDIKIIASILVSEKQLDGTRLSVLSGLSPLRINRAVGFIEDYGIAQVEHEAGTGVYNFGFIWATGKTRRFVEEKCN